MQLSWFRLFLSLCGALVTILASGCIVQAPPSPSAQDVAAQIERDYGNSNTSASSPNSAAAPIETEGPQPSAAAIEEAAASINTLGTDESFRLASKTLFAEQSSFINQGRAGDETNSMGSLASAFDDVAAGKSGEAALTMCTYTNIQFAPAIAKDLQGVAEEPWSATESAGLTDQQMANYDAGVEFTSGLVSEVPRTCAKLIAEAEKEARRPNHHRNKSTSAEPPGEHTL